MSRPSDIWTPSTKLAFHRNVEALNAWNREPYTAEDYRSQTAPVSDGNILSYSVEQHIVDHIAFLAQSEEGARYVSAAMAEEHAGGDGLTIRLAANQTPSQNVLQGLKDIVGILEIYATKGKSRDMYCEQMFDQVVHFSRQRIHERLRSKKSPRSSRICPIEERPPLYSRLRKQVQAIRKLPRYHTRALTKLNSDLEELANCYQATDSFENDETEHELLKTAIRRSFEISTTGGRKSLEEYLKHLGLSPAVHQGRAVLDIDKISRYLGLCRDLIYFSRQPAYRSLFTNILIECCKSPPAVRPVAGGSRCHVHGEVQLILHYEQYPYRPAPRAIGSSKSACFLCDLFIKEHGQYRVSHSHKRLYHQWTIPDVHWMTVQQANRFRVIIQTMTSELALLLRTCPKLAKNFSGLESRAHLLDPALRGSAASTPSVLSQPRETANGPATPPMTPLQPISVLNVTESGIKPDDIYVSDSTAEPEIPKEPDDAPIKPGDLPKEPDTFIESEALTVADAILAPEALNIAENITLPDTTSAKSFQAESLKSSDSISIISVSRSNLPYSQPISLLTPSLHLQLGQLSITIEFVAIFSGRLLVAATEDDIGLNCTDRHTVEVADVPTASEMHLSCVGDSNELVVRLRMSVTEFIYVIFVWD